MDPSLLKKRKSDENGSLADPSPSTNLTPEDARKIIEPFTQEQLLEILQIAVCRHVDVLDSVRSIADRDPVQRKLFIRGLGWDTTTEGLRSLFSAYGELEEAVVILDKTTGKSKGYGFITFKHIDGAMRALKEPSKKIDGRMTVTQLAATGISGGGGPQAGHQVQAPDVSARKIYVGNVPNDMPADRLLAHFSSYGEIEEGPLGYDKQTGKSRGFALFVYKTQDAARASLVDPLKSIDGHSLMCKLAIEGKKGKPMGPATVQNVAGAGGEVPGGEGAMPPPSSMPGSFGSQYGGPGAGLGVPGGLGAPAGLSPYGVFAAAHQGPQGLGHHQPHPLSSALQSSIGAAGLSSVGSQVPSSLGGGAGGYGAGLGGGYGGLGGGPNSGGYGHGGPGAAGYGGVGYGGLGVGAGASLHRLPSGGYPEGAGHYSLSSSAFPGPHQSSASSPVPRVGPGSMYPNLPPYY